MDSLQYLLTEPVWTQGVCLAAGTVLLTTIDAKVFRTLDNKLVTINNIMSITIKKLEID